MHFHVRNHDVTKIFYVYDVKSNLLISNRIADTLFSTIPPISCNTLQYVGIPFPGAPAG